MDNPVFGFDSPVGRIEIKCRKDETFFYCNVNSLVYKNEVKLEKAKLTEGIAKFLEWLK